MFLIFSERKMQDNLLNKKRWKVLSKGFES